MSMLGRTFRGLRGATWALLGAGLLLAPLGGAGLQAQPPRDGGSRSVKGVVREFTTAPKGEVDGMILDDGTLVHWPPHLGDKVANLLPKKDRVRVTGRMEPGPKGDTKLEAESIVNLTTSQALEVGDAAPPPKKGKGKGLPKGPRGGQTSTARGVVREFTTAPKGEIDGLILDDGTVVHWPPHLESRYTRLVSKGDRIEATGRMETGPEGDTHLEVQDLTNLSSNAARDNDVPRRRPGRGPDND